MEEIGFLLNRNFDRNIKTLKMYLPSLTIVLRNACGQELAHKYGPTGDPPCSLKNTEGNNNNNRYV